MQPTLAISEDVDGDRCSDAVVGATWGARLIRCISGEGGDEIWTHDTHEYGGGGWVYQVDYSYDYNGDGIIIGTMSLVRQLRMNFTSENLIMKFKNLFFVQGQILRYNGDNWEEIGENLFGGSNLNAYSAIVLNGSCYFGTANWYGGEIWKTENGISWVQISKRGFYRPLISGCGKCIHTIIDL